VSVTRLNYFNQMLEVFMLNREAKNNVLGGNYENFKNILFSDFKFGGDG
jgi:hypothetical protein